MEKHIRDVPSALERRAEISAHLQGKRVAVFLDYDGTLTPIVSRPEDALLSELGPEWRATLTGSFAVYHDMTVDIQRTQLSSFGIAAIVVFLILTLFLRTLGGSAAAAVVNLRDCSLRGPVSQSRDRQGSSSP